MVKTEERIAYFKREGIRFMDVMPAGWVDMKYATTAPAGYKWIWNPATCERALWKIDKMMPEKDKLMQQYDELKAKHPDALLLFRSGGFYDTYKDSARTIAERLGLTLCQRNGVDFAGFPSRMLDVYLPKLVRMGYRIAICDQLESMSNVRKAITEKVEPKRAKAIQLQLNF